MKFAYSLADWQALAPGLSDNDAWQSWAQQPPVFDSTQDMAKPRMLPMMTARRLSGGSRAAVECALALQMRQPTDAIIFTSRHGELERNLRILTALASGEALSPTDFAMSVHNSAVGSLTIAAKQPWVSTSISAGLDSFQQGMIEVSALHQAGYPRVMLVDFDGAVPDYYLPWLPEGRAKLPYAVALLLIQGEDLQCETRPVPGEDAALLPQSLAFLHGVLSDAARFCYAGERQTWCWEKKHD